MSGLLMLCILDAWKAAVRGLWYSVPLDITWVLGTMAMITQQLWACSGTASNMYGSLCCGEQKSGIFCRGTVSAG